MARTEHNNNIVLIGMAGAGKSTVGVQLAKSMAMGFVDTDIELQQDIGCGLQEYLDQHGYQALRNAESTTLGNGRWQSKVISTGGSAVYSDVAMQHLRAQALVVYLQVSLATIQARIGDWSGRGVAAPANLTLAEIFEERVALYERYADIVVDASPPSMQVATTIQSQVEQRWWADA